MMDTGRDPRETVFLSLELTVSWLLAVAYRIAFAYPQLLGRLLEKSLFMLKNCFVYIAHHMTRERTLRIACRLL